MKVLTGNDLETGVVTWWDGKGWSLHVEDAVDVSENGAAILESEELARRVNVPYEIEAELDANGAPRPAHIKDRIRALGPTVRMDLTLKPDDANAAANVEKVV